MLNLDNKIDKNSKKNIHYDFVIIGSSIISTLEAIYLSRKGKSVLMIDEANDIGGAWKCIDIFNLHNVENAVHYLLPDKKGISFMKKYLKWKIIKSKNKYRTFYFPLLGYQNLIYDNSLSRLVDKIINKKIVNGKNNFFFEVLIFLYNNFNKLNYQSYYIEGGSPEILKKTKSMLLDSTVKTKYQTKIKEVIIEEHPSKVTCITNNALITSEKIIVSHGSLINKLTSSGGE